MHCLFWIYKYCNRPGYSANATDSSVSHNIWIDHLTNYSSTRSNPAPENLWRPQTRPSGQEEGTASLLLPEIIISIIFYNFQHLNRAHQVRKQSRGSQSTASLRKHTHRGLWEHPHGKRLPSKNSLCSWRPQREACFQRSHRSCSLLLLNVWNQALAKNYNYRWYTDWNHRGRFFCWGKLS